MSIFSRLAIGTAAWGKEYNGVKVSEDDQKRILDYAQCSGIDMIDTAVAYEWDWTKINSSFNVVVKATEDIPLREQDILMAHTPADFPKMKGAFGASLYEPWEYSYYFPHRVCVPKIMQIPYSIFDRRFEEIMPCMKCEIHVRSIFLRGKILERFKPWECIAFCLANPYIDRIIIGVDSYQQLKDNLRIFHRWESSGIEDLDVIDPRRWPVTCYDNKGNIIPEKEKKND